MMSVYIKQYVDCSFEEATAIKQFVGVLPDGTGGKWEIFSIVDKTIESPQFGGNKCAIQYEDCSLDISQYYWERILGPHCWVKEIEGEMLVLTSNEVCNYKEYEITNKDISIKLELTQLPINLINEQMEITITFPNFIQ